MSKAYQGAGIAAGEEVYLSIGAPSKAAALRLAAKYNCSKVEPAPGEIEPGIMLKRLGADSDVLSEDDYFELRRLQFAPKPGAPEDLSDVRGQEHAKRALELACAGGHEIVLCGGPGFGKTALLDRFGSIMRGLGLPEVFCHTARPCPCGWSGDSMVTCECSTEELRAWRTKARAAWRTAAQFILVPRVPVEKIMRPVTDGYTDASARCALRIKHAREIAIARQGKPNGELSGADIDRLCGLDDAGRALLSRGIDRLALSPADVHNVLRVALTASDLDTGIYLEKQMFAPQAGRIGVCHLAEALQYISGKEQLIRL